MTESLKKYLNSDPQVKEEFIMCLDEGRLFDAYKICTNHVYDKDIFDLFSETECFENYNQSKNYWFEVYDLTFDKEDIVSVETPGWNKDPVIFNSMTDVLNALTPYKSYYNYRIKKSLKKTPVRPFGKYYRLDCFVPDIQSRISVFDEDNIVDAIRGTLNQLWSDNTMDMYDGKIDKTAYVIKLLKIKIDKNKKTTGWIATVRYRIAAVDKDSPTYVNKTTGECSAECTVTIPRNKKLTKEVLLQADAVSNFDITWDWVQKSNYDRQQLKQQNKENQELLLNKLRRKIIASLSEYEIEVSAYPPELNVNYVDDIFIDYEMNERTFNLIEGESLEDTYIRFDKFIQTIKDVVIPYVQEKLRIKKNKEERTNYIEKVIEQVKDELKDTLPDIRSYFTHDTTVKFVSDRLLKSVNYELDGETGEVEFDKSKFKLQTIIADILAIMKPEKDRIHGRSPLILHLNEKKKND